MSALGVPLNRISEVSQLNGITLATKIEDIKLITTPSSIKFCKFGKKDKWFFDWLEQVEKSKKPFGIVNFIHFCILEIFIEFH
mgnify:CR=1 FL=1